MYWRYILLVESIYVNNIHKGDVLSVYVDECIESLDFYNGYTHKEGNSIV